MAFAFPPHSNNKSSKFHSYENTKSAINESLKQFADFTNAINEVCNQANVFGRSLQALEDMSVPEIIGSEQVQKVSSNRMKNNGLLLDSLDTFSKIMLSFSEKIKNEAIDSFDNFIIQAIAPSPDEIKGIFEHNSQIVNEFRESFFSLYNHFLILAAELMEKFLLCNNCSTPIGFPHQPLCLTESMSNIWKKTKFDDKFITFGMNLCFNDLILPESRKNILMLIANSCWKQNMVQSQPKVSLPLMTKSWPKRWLRGDKKKTEKRAPMRTRAVYHPQPHQPLFQPSIWTPSSGECSHEANYQFQFLSFCYKPPN